MVSSWSSFPASFAGEAVLALYVFALVFAALSDLVSLRIPNWLTGALALGFPIAALIAGIGLSGHHVDWLSHIEAGAAVFAGGAMLFACRILGGGDVKLLAAMGLWCGIHLLVPLIFLTAVIGGVFGLIVLGLRQPLLHTTILAVLRRIPDFLYAKKPIPYGIPIAIAGVMLAPHLPFLA
jgi:prepilin peptidase CpaA